MRTLALFLIFGGFASAGEEPAVVRELKAEQLDYFLNAAFARYGHEPQRTIGIGRSGVRFRLKDPPATNTQCGVYSHFTLAGDFRVAADYTVVTLDSVKTGYGMSFGLAVHTNGPSGSVFIARGSHPEWKSCIIVTREIPEKDGAKKYEASFRATGESKGRIGLRREGDLLIAETIDASGTATEVTSFPKFGRDPITQVRLYADTGGAPGTMDGWFDSLAISADSIVGAALPPEPFWSWTTWLLAASAMLVVIGIVIIVRRKRRLRNED